MTNRKYYNAVFSLAFLLFSLSIAAQTRTTVSARANRSQILIGEPVILVLEAHIPESEPIRFFHIDTFPHFEILEKTKIDTADTREGSVLSQVIRITSFDSGHWVIPSFDLYNGPVTDTIPVDVGLSPFNPEQPYHDIKDIIDVQPEKKIKWPWWWFAAGGALFLALLILLLLRKKKPIPVTALPPDPYKAAMAQLEQLRKDPGPAKQYYSRLVDIFRIYVYARKGIHSLQKTTDDLVTQLRGLGLPKEQYDQLAQALRLSDFVKFARYTSIPEDDRHTFEAIKKTIDAIEQLK